MQIFESLDAIHRWALEALFKEGQRAEPRGLATLELSPVAVTLERPRRRCLTNRARRWNLPAAIGEFAWHAAGSTDLGFISYYFKRWTELADDAMSVRGSCYGHRIFGRIGTGESQWERVAELLRSDPWSRRAVLDVYDPELGFRKTVKDAPCACTLQFLIRDDRLHLVTYMRSNDVIWGLPYDVFVFTMLQELLGRELRRPLGTYTHIAGSLHLYENHFALGKEILRSPTECEFEMPLMTAPGELPNFLDIEARLRSGGAVPEDELGLDLYWSSLITVLESYRIFKATGSPERALERVPTGSRYGVLLENLWRSDVAVGGGVPSEPGESQSRTES